jgi:hypothetical protein
MNIAVPSHCIVLDRGLVRRTHIIAKTSERVSSMEKRFNAA